MNPVFQIASFFVDLVFPLVAGYLLVRHTRFRTEQIDPLLNVTIVGIVPVLVLLSFWQLDLALSLAWLPVLGVGMQIIPGALGFVRSRRKAHNSLEKGSYLLASILSNRGVVGALAVFILFGETGFGYAQLVMVFGPAITFGVMYPVAGYFYAHHQGEAGQRPSLLGEVLSKRQMPIVGIAIGLSLNLAGVDRPEVCGAVFSVLVHVVAWSMLLPIGASIDPAEMRAYWRDVIDLVPLKFVVTPLCIWAIAFYGLGMEGKQLWTVTLLACSPTAINAVVTSKLYKLNVHVATAAFVLTTTLYLAVIFPAVLVVALGR